MFHQKVQCIIAEELLTDLGLANVGFQGGVRELSWCGGDGGGIMRGVTAQEVV